MKCDNCINKDDCQAYNSGLGELSLPIKNCKYYATKGSLKAKIEGWE